MQTSISLKQSAVILFPNAKINLGLTINRKLEDGFHDIESVLYPIPLYDVIEFRPAKKFNLRVFGLSLPGSEDKNLLTKTWQLFRHELKIPPIEIQLLKNIPSGTGLGGGSSDAAFLLKSLNDLFQIHLSKTDLTALAGKLGSDVPFFIENEPQLASGRGDQLTPVDVSLKGYTLVLIVPPFSISTQEAYSRWKKTTNFQRKLQDIVQLPVAQWGDQLKNDFELLLFHDFPQLAAIKKELLEAGAFYVSLTGSGSGIYGIFERKPELTFNPPGFLTYHLPLK